MDKENTIPHVVAFSQYDGDLSKRGVQSACGPATIATIYHYYYPSNKPQSQLIKYWYKKSFTTWFGLSAFLFSRSLSEYGQSFKINKNQLWEQYVKEIDQGRPVGVKFDKWSALKWFTTYDYSYHWVTGVGYEVKNEQKFLLVLTNSRNKHAIKKIPFGLNRPILTMIMFSPTSRRT